MELLGRTVSLVRRVERRPNHRGHGTGRDSPRDAIARLEPNGEQFSSLARVATDAAERNVLSGDDSRIIHDVLPRSASPTFGRGSDERSAAVHALAITLLNLALEPSGDVPSVHAVRSCRLTFAQSRA